MTSVDVIDPPSVAVSKPLVLVAKVIEPADSAQCSETTPRAEVAVIPAGARSASAFIAEAIEAARIVKEVSVDRTVYWKF